MEYLVAHFFAGLWTLIWHFGVGIGVIVLLCVTAYFVPGLKTKALCLALAGVVAAFVIGEGVGVRIERAHTQAQQAQVNNFVDKAVQNSTTKKSRGATDPWNSRGN